MPLRLAKSLFVKAGFRLVGALKRLFRRQDFWEWCEQRCIRSVGGEVAAKNAGSIYTFKPLVEQWTKHCQSRQRNQNAEKDDLNRIFNMLVGSGPNGADPALEPDAMRVLFDLAPGPRAAAPAKNLGVMDNVCIAPPGYERMSAYAEERIHQLGLWVASVDGPRGIHLLAGSRGAGKSEFIQSINDCYVPLARSMPGSAYWPLCTKISISPAVQQAGDVVQVLMAQLVDDVRSVYWRSMGSWEWWTRVVADWANSGIIALGRFAHQNRLLLRLGSGLALCALLIAGFFLSAGQAPLRVAPALVFAPVSLPIDHISIFATLFILVSMLGINALGVAYRWRSSCAKEDWRAILGVGSLSGPIMGPTRVVIGLFVFSMVGLVAYSLIDLQPKARTPADLVTDTILTIFSVAVVMQQASLALARLSARAELNLARVGDEPELAFSEKSTGRPTWALGDRPIADLARAMGELLPAVVGVSFVALIALAPTDLWSDIASPYLFWGPFTGFHLILALVAVLLIWTLALPRERYLLDAIESAASKLSEERSTKAPDMPSPFWVWASKLLPSFEKPSPPTHFDARAQEAMIEVCDLAVRIFKRVIVLIDDVDILPSDQYPQILRALRPLMKAGPGVVAVVSVPPSFHHAFRIGLMNDVHSTVRDEILLAPRFLFDTVERVQATSNLHSKEDGQIHALRPGCVLVGSGWKALPSQLALRSDVMESGLFERQRDILLEWLGEILIASSRLPLAPGVMDLKDYYRKMEKRRKQISEELDLEEDYNGVAGYWVERINFAIEQGNKRGETPATLLRRMGPSIREWKRWLGSLMVIDREVSPVPVRSEDLYQTCTGVVSSVSELARAMESVLWFESLSEDIFMRKAVSDFAKYIHEAEADRSSSTLNAATH